MRIGFDISQVGAEAGCGYYADALSNQLIQEFPDDEFLLYRTFGTMYWNPSWSELVPRSTAGNCEHPAEFKSRDESNGFWGSCGGIDEVRCGSPDILHANNFFCPRTSEARVVYTVYDLGFIDVPDCTTEANRFICFDGVFNASLYADMVIAISHYTRNRFLELFPHFPADRAVVAHLGNRLDVEGLTQKRKGNIPDEFFLTVGTLEPRKNLRLLLAAYKSYADRTASPKQLVLAGGKGWLEHDLPEYITDLGLGDLVCITGFILDEELRWLYKRCHAFVYPSLYEGFGLPVLEAMSLGAAVITSNSTSLPEVGGDAALYVEPHNKDSITHALEQVDDIACCRDLKARSIQQATQFSWSATAGVVRDSYERALALPKRA